MFELVMMDNINETDENKVEELVNTILRNGWVGAPILYHTSIGLITGSHRSEALRVIAEMYDNEDLTEGQKAIVAKIDEDDEYALDVTDIVDEWVEDNDEQIEYDSLGRLFEGTEVEKYKDEIEEW